MNHYNFGVQSYHKLVQVVINRILPKSSVTSLSRALLTPLPSTHLLEFKRHTIDKQISYKELSEQPTQHNINYLFN